MNEKTLQLSSVTESTYPNPGFLGASSHASIFNHFESIEKPQAYFNGTNSHTRSASDTPPEKIDDKSLQDGQALIQQIQTDLHMPHAIDLVNFWLTRGTNLALAEPFIPECVKTMKALSSDSADAHFVAGLTLSLYKNSSTPIRYEGYNSLTSFASQFLHDNIRWETVGLFFTSLSRAITDVPNFSPIYDSQAQRKRLMAFAVTVGDRCLEICLSLDSMNDLQLILQFENFILHTLVDGDQSQSGHSEHP